MPAPLSIVIPTLNAADRLLPLFDDMMAGVVAGLLAEVILADGGSSDGVARLADAAGARIVTAPPGRGTQLRHALEKVPTDWVLVLHADSRLPQGWQEIVLTHMTDHADRAGYFRLKFASTHPMARVTAGWANARSRIFGLPYGDQGLLMPMALYREVGGYPDVPLMEDVAIARRLRGRIEPMAGTITTSPERYAAHGWVGQGGRNLVRLARYLSGASPETLGKTYDARSSSN